MPNKSEDQILGATGVLATEPITSYTDTTNRKIISSERIEKIWEEHFASFQEKAREIANSNPDNVKNPEKAVADFMEALRSIYIEITIEDQIKAVVEGLKKAVEEAKNRGVDLVLLKQDICSTSDRLLFDGLKTKADSFCDESGISFQIVDLMEVEGSFVIDVLRDKVVLLVDDAAYSGEQKSLLINQLLGYNFPFHLLLSFGGCSKLARDVFTNLFQGKRSTIEVISQIDIPDLASELEKKGPEAYFIGLKIFPPFVDNGVLNNMLIAPFTTFRIPDPYSVPKVLRPAGIFEYRSLYPQSL